jgi:hypothetical protein
MKEAFVASKIAAAALDPQAQDYNQRTQEITDAAEQQLRRVHDEVFDSRNPQRVAYIDFPQLEQEIAAINTKEQMDLSDHPDQRDTDGLDEIRQTGEQDRTQLYQAVADDYLTKLSIIELTLGGGTYNAWRDAIVSQLRLQMAATGTETLPMVAVATSSRQLADLPSTASGFVDSNRDYINTNFDFTQDPSMQGPDLNTVTGALLAAQNVLSVAPDAMINEAMLSEDFDSSGPVQMNELFAKLNGSLRPAPDDSEANRRYTDRTFPDIPCLDTLSAGCTGAQEQNLTTDIGLSIDQDYHDELTRGARNWAATLSDQELRTFEKGYDSSRFLLARGRERLGQSGDREVRANRSQVNVFDTQPVRPDRRRLAQLFATACCSDDMMRPDFDANIIANPDKTISKAKALDMLRLASPGSTMEQIEGQVGLRATLTWEEMRVMQENLAQRRKTSRSPFLTELLDSTDDVQTYDDLREHMYLRAAVMDRLKQTNRLDYTTQRTKVRNLQDMKAQYTALGTKVAMAQPRTILLDPEQPPLVVDDTGVPLQTDGIEEHLADAFARLTHESEIQKQVAVLQRNNSDLSTEAARTEAQQEVRQTERVKEARRRFLSGNNRRQWQPEVDPSWEATLYNRALLVNGGEGAVPVRKLTESNLSDAFATATGVANSENEMSRAMLQVVRHAASVYNKHTASQESMQLMPSDLIKMQQAMADVLPEGFHLTNPAQLDVGAERLMDVWSQVTECGGLSAETAMVERFQPAQIGELKQLDATIGQNRRQTLYEGRHVLRTAGSVARSISDDWKGTPAWMHHGERNWRGAGTSVTDRGLRRVTFSEPTHALVFEELMAARSHLDGKFDTGDPDVDAYINDHMQDLALNLLDLSTLPPDANPSVTAEHIKQQAEILYKSSEDAASGKMGVCILQHFPTECRERFEQMSDEGKQLSRDYGFMDSNDLMRHAARIVAVRSATEAASRAAARVQTSGMTAAAVDAAPAITDEAFQSVTNFARRVQGLPVRDSMSSNESKMRLAAMREEFRQGAPRGVTAQAAAYAWLSESNVGAGHAERVPFSYSPELAQIPQAFTPDAHAEFKQHIEFLRTQRQDGKVPADEVVKLMSLYSGPDPKLGSRASAMVVNTAYEMAGGRWDAPQREILSARYAATGLTAAGSPIWATEMRNHLAQYEATFQRAETNELTQEDLEAMETEFGKGASFSMEDVIIP